MTKKSRLRQFGRGERKDNNDWVKHCMTWEVEGIRQTGRPKKTWWDCVKNDMESLGLSQKNMQFRNIGVQYGRNDSCLCQNVLFCMRRFRISTDLFMIIFPLIDLST